MAQYPPQAERGPPPPPPPPPSNTTAAEAEVDPCNDNHRFAKRF